MKKILILYFTLIPLLLYGQYQKSCKERTKELSPIPADFRNLIQNSKSTRWMLIDPIANKKDSTICLLQNVGEILCSKIDTVNESRIETIALLLSPVSFVNDSTVKNCTFLPDIAIEFINGDNSIVVMYSFYCDVCRFSQNGKYHDLNGEIIREDLMRLALDKFPKDRYLRKIAKRTR